MAIALSRPETGAAFRSSAASTALRGLSDDLVDLRHRLCRERGILAGDFDVLAAAAAMPGAAVDELASACHLSMVGTRAALGRLHDKAPGTAYNAGGVLLVDFQRTPSGQRVNSSNVEVVAVSNKGRELLADVHGAMETSLEAVIGLLRTNDRDLFARVLEHCRGAVWEAGSDPVVAVLEVAE